MSGIAHQGDDRSKSNRGVRPSWGCVYGIVTIQQATMQRDVERELFQSGHQRILSVDL